MMKLISRSSARAANFDKALLTFFALISSTILPAEGFAPGLINDVASTLARNRVLNGPSPFSPNFTQKVSPEIVRGYRSDIIKSKNIDDDEPDNLIANLFRDVPVNPPYAIAFALFLGYAYVRTLSEVEGASLEVLQGFFADPLNPGCNELFALVFNTLGLVFFPMACLLMPGAKDQKFPAAPFILGSMFGGYGILAPYIITRKPVTSVQKSELSWVTLNVLENKLFSLLALGLSMSAVVSTGCATRLFDDPTGLVKGYAELLSETAIASASSVDLAILTITAASLIPEDLKRRGIKNGAVSVAVASSTLLLPVVGSILYCLLRPGLEYEEK